MQFTGSPSDLVHAVERIIADAAKRSHAYSDAIQEVRASCSYGMSCTGAVGRAGGRELVVSWPIFRMVENQPALRDVVLDVLASLVTPGPARGPEQRQVAQAIGCAGAGAHFLTVPEEHAACMCAICLAAGDRRGSRPLRKLVPFKARSSAPPLSRVRDRSTRSA